MLKEKQVQTLHIYYSYSLCYVTAAVAQGYKYQTMPPTCETLLLLVKQWTDMRLQDFSNRIKHLNHYIVVALYGSFLRTIDRLH